MRERCESMSEQGSEWLITLRGDFTFYSFCGDGRKRVKTRASDGRKREQEAYENAIKKRAKTRSKSFRKREQEAWKTAIKKLS